MGIQGRILVTGGSGLVGAYTTAMLLERAQYPIVFDVAINENLLHVLGIDKSLIGMVRSDLLDLSALISTIREFEVDRIIHLGGLMGEEVQRRPYSGVSVNVLGTVNVLEAARLEGISRVVFGSSGTAYLGSLHDGLDKVDEQIPVNPSTLYGATKATSEWLGRSYGRSFGFDFYCIRYVGGIYGPSSTTYKSIRERAIQAMVRAAMNGYPANIDWPCGNIELMYGKDAAKGVVLACLENEAKDRLFHIGSGELVGGENVLKALSKQFPTTRIELTEVSYPLPQIVTPIVSTNFRARKQLGYEPDYPLENALRDYADTLRKLDAVS